MITRGCFNFTVLNGRGLVMDHVFSVGKLLLILFFSAACASGLSHFDALILGGAVQQDLHQHMD